MGLTDSRADRSAVGMRIEPRIWVGLVAAAVFVVVVAGLANLLTAAIPIDDPIGELVLGHVTVLVPMIVAGVIFVRWAGWSGIVWRTPSARETTPRRWWLLAFPVLLLIQTVTVLAGAPWSAWQLGPVLLVAFVCLLIGFGEELYFRGILRASIRHRHGETLALLLTSLAFGLAHTFTALFAGADVGGVLFEVAVTALAGAVYYGAYRATGRLWVPIALHALDDFSLHIGSADLTAHPVNTDPSALTITVQAVLWGLALVLLISCIREDRRNRRALSPQIAE